MKKMKNMLINHVRLIAGALTVLVLFSACKKQDLNNASLPPLAGLMAFNLSPDQPAVGFDVASNRLANNAYGYTNYTGVYLPVYTGTSEVRAFDFNTGSTLAFSNLNFSDSSYYSTFLLGANGNYRNITVMDNLNLLAATNGKAWVRYVNAIPDSTTNPVIMVSSNGDNNITDTAHYGSVSDFVQVSAGQVNASIGNGTTISASRAMTLEENKIYTFLFVGIPAAADTGRAVQIRFIQNGSITR